ncbi:MAG: hypothetical protein BAA01_04010 [Bacillus thermozeamaize]|uniref:Uncharacterized protein n=1 Tax=Bacillus thermozeamaize TaxID=230954 RepID=A0A1Y3PI30_9BACI|nr:MAG: hypothetical protein BAA01_04010 [Bacillus thermozeamaize]
MISPVSDRLHLILIFKTKSRFTPFRSKSGLFTIPLWYAHTTLNLAHASTFHKHFLPYIGLDFLDGLLHGKDAKEVLDQDDFNQAAWPGVCEEQSTWFK